MKYHHLKHSMTMIGAIVYSLSILYACQSHEGSEKQLKEDVDSFATNYYNWHFKEATKYCTPESEKWLQYAASNVQQTDINQLRAKETDAAIEVQDIQYHGNGMSATIKLQVTNFLQMDTIGTEAHYIEKASFLLPIVLHDGKWKIQLEKLPSKL